MIKEELREEIEDKIFSDLPIDVGESIITIYQPAYSNKMLISLDGQYTFKELLDLVNVLIQNEDEMLEKNFDYIKEDE